MGYIQLSDLLMALTWGSSVFCARQALREWRRYRTFCKKSATRG